MAKTAENRPWLAAVLSFLAPGLGHFYLREWVRGILWFGLITVASSILVPDLSAPVALTADSILATSEELSAMMSWDAKIALIGVLLLSVADAHRIAIQANTNAAIEEGEKCPHCGKPADEDIDFCHWCTTPLDQSSGFSAEQCDAE